MFYYYANDDEQNNELYVKESINFNYNESFIEFTKIKTYCKNCSELFFFKFKLFKHLTTCTKALLKQAYLTKLTKFIILITFSIAISKLIFVIEFTLKSLKIIIFKASQKNISFKFNFRV